MSEQNQKQGNRVLVIDDERMMLEVVETILEDLGHTVTCCSSALEGLKIALEEDFDLILVDIHMPAKDGAEVIEGILARRPDATILVLTGHPNDPRVRVALDAGAKGLVRKPFDIGKVLEFLDG